MEQLPKPAQDVELLLKQLELEHTSLENDIDEYFRFHKKLSNFLKIPDKNNPQYTAAKKFAYNKQKWLLCCKRYLDFAVKENTDQTYLGHIEHLREFSADRNEFFTRFLSKMTADFLKENPAVADLFFLYLKESLDQESPKYAEIQVFLSKNITIYIRFTQWKQEKAIAESSPLSLGPAVARDSPDRKIAQRSGQHSLQTRLPAVSNSPFLTPPTISSPMTLSPQAAIRPTKSAAASPQSLRSVSSPAHPPINSLSVGSPSSSKNALLEPIGPLFSLLTSGQSVATPTPLSAPSTPATVLSVESSASSIISQPAPSGWEGFFTSGLQLCTPVYLHNLNIEGVFYDFLMQHPTQKARWLKKDPSKGHPDHARRPWLEKMQSERATSSILALSDKESAATSPLQAPALSTPSASATALSVAASSTSSSLQSQRVLGPTLPETLVYARLKKEYESCKSDTKKQNDFFDHHRNKLISSEWFLENSTLQTLFFQYLVENIMGRDRVKAEEIKKFIEDNPTIKKWFVVTGIKKINKLKPQSFTNELLELLIDFLSKDCDDESCIAASELLWKSPWWREKVMDTLKSWQELHPAEDKSTSFFQKRKRKREGDEGEADRQKWAKAWKNINELGRFTLPIDARPSPLLASSIFSREQPAALPNQVLVIEALLELTAGRRVIENAPAAIASMPDENPAFDDDSQFLALMEWAASARR